MTFQRESRISDVTLDYFLEQRDAIDYAGGRPGQSRISWHSGNGPRADGPVPSSDTEADEVDGIESSDNEGGVASALSAITAPRLRRCGGMSAPSRVNGDSIGCLSSLSHFPPTSPALSPDGRTQGLVERLRADAGAQAETKTHTGEGPRAIPDKETHMSPSDRDDSSSDELPEMDLQEMVDKRIQSTSRSQAYPSEYKTQKQLVVSDYSDDIAENSLSPGPSSLAFEYTQYAAKSSNRPQRSAARASPYIFRPSLRRSISPSSTNRYAGNASPVSMPAKRPKLDIASLLREKRARDRRGMGNAAFEETDELVKQQRQKETQREQSSELEGLQERLDAKHLAESTSASDAKSVSAMAASGQHKCRLRSVDRATGFLDFDVASDDGSTSSASSSTDLSEPGSGSVASSREAEILPGSLLPYEERAVKVGCASASRCNSAADSTISGPAVLRQSDPVDVLGRALSASNPDSEENLDVMDILRRDRSTCENRTAANEIAVEKRAKERLRFWRGGRLPVSFSTWTELMDCAKAMLLRAQNHSSYLIVFCTVFATQAYRPSARKVQDLSTDPVIQAIYSAVHGSS